MKPLPILLICLLIIVTFSGVCGQTFVSSKETLAGVKVMKVLVEGLSSDAKADGLTESQIKTDVELRLRRSGIKVEDSPLLPYLYVNLNALKSRGASLYAYPISIGFNQDVILERNRAISTTAETWKTGSVGTVGSNNLRQLREAINDSVDEFINDYLAANASSSVRDLPPPPASYNKSQDDSPNFVARYVGGNRPPQIEVKNIADRTLNIEFGGKKFVIPSGQNEVINTTDGGMFSFEATAPGVIPLKGQRMFERGYVYTWTFFIKTTSR